MILLTSRPLGSPPRYSSGRLTSLTTSCACVTSCRCSSASASSPVVGSSLRLHSALHRLTLLSSGIPFMYRGLPCIYSSAILSSASLLSGGNLALLRVLAMAMIIFMISQTFYPHDRVLESQAWKKVVYAGGKTLLISPCFNSRRLQEDRHNPDSSEQDLHGCPGNMLLSSV